MIEFFLMAFFAARSPRPADGGTRPAANQAANPVDIKSDDLEIFDKKHLAIWVGHVKAKSGTTDLSCDRLIAHYTKSQEITTIECVGNAEVQDGDKWARGERADFDNRTGVLEVTGSPEAKQGTTHVRGTKVIFYKDKDTIRVENARTVFETKDSKPPKEKK